MNRKQRVFLPFYIENSDIFVVKIFYFLLAFQIIIITFAKLFDFVSKNTVI